METIAERLKAQDRRIRPLVEWGKTRARRASLYDLDIGRMFEELRRDKSKNPDDVLAAKVSLANIRNELKRREQERAKIARERLEKERARKAEERERRRVERERKRQERLRKKIGDFPVKCEHIRLEKGVPFRCWACEQKYDAETPFVTTSFREGSDEKACIVCAYAINFIMKFGEGKKGKFESGFLDYTKTATNSFYRKLRLAVFSAFNGGGEDGYNALVKAAHELSESDFREIVDQLSSKAVMRRNTAKALRRYEPEKLKKIVDRSNRRNEDEKANRKH